MDIFQKTSKKKIILFFFLSFGIISCNEKQIQYDDAIVIQCLNCTNEINFSSDNNNIFKQIEYIQLETTDDCLLKEIDYIEIIDTVILVVDNNRVYRFSKTNGEFLSELGSRGQGPRDHVSVKNLYVDRTEGTVSILDISQSKIIEYDFSGNYISTRSMGLNTNLTNMAFNMTNGDMLFHNLLSPYSKSAFSVSIENADLIIDLLSYGNFEVKSYSVTFSKHPMTYTDEGVYCIMPFDNKIYLVKNDDVHRMDVKYAVEYPGKPSNMVMAKQEKPGIFITRLLMAKENCFPGFTAIFESSGKLILNTFNNQMQSCFFYGDMTKLNGKYYNYSLSPEEDDPVFEITNVSENMFIAKLEASRLADWKKLYKGEDMEKIKNQHLRTVIETSDVEDNQCLVIYYAQ